MTVEQARRRLARRVAAVLIQAMAETDKSVEDVARALEVKPERIQHRLNRLIEGDGANDQIDFIADFAFACGVDLRFSIVPLPKELER